MRELTDNVSGMFVYTCSQLTVLIFGNYFISTFFSSLEGLNFDAVLSDDLGDVGGLVHDEASAEFYDAQSHSFHSLLEGHVLLEVVV